MSNINTLLKIASSRVGVTEYPKDSNKVDANTWYYGKEVQGASYPWCCVEMQYEFHLAGLDHLLKKTASCADLGDWFKSNNSFYTSNPQVGDLVFFKFKTNRHNRWCNHVGLVIEINSNNTITTIEGNTSFDDKGSQDNGGAVARRKRNYTYIIGFGRPKYDQSENTNQINNLIIDISKYNLISNYDQLAKDVKGVIIRAGYRGSQTGQIVEDPRFKTHITELLKRNVKIGLYFYTQAINEAEGAEEARWLVEQAKQYKIDYPLFIDSEYSKEQKGRADRLDKITRTKIMTAFCKEISKAGYVAGVYASDSWFKNQLNFEELKDWFIWCARYSTSSPTIGKYDAWQYESQFFSWATDKIDVNHWYNNDPKVITPDITPKQPFKNIVKVNTHLNIRNKPVVGDVVGKLNNGDTVVVIGYQKGWLQIGSNEWVSETYVHSSYGLVTANSLNVRKGNSTAYESLGFVHKNNNVKIVKELGGWYQIIAPNGLFGWASSKYIDLI